MKYITVLAIALGILYLPGCTSDFENKNTNPDNATDEMLDTDNLRTGSAFSQMTRNVIPTYQLTGDEEYGSGNYQIIQDLAGNIFAGYTGAVSTGFVANNHYDVTAASWYNAMFEDAFTRVISAWNQMNNHREEFPEVVAMGDILKVAAMHRVTDTYGPIPYSASTEGSVQNDYDSQEQVYNMFFQELDDAINVLTEYHTLDNNAKLLERFDNVYYGSVENWIKFANTLRLRLAMRVAYADENLARTQASAAVTHSIGVMTVASDVARINKPNSGGWEYPLYIIQYNFNDSRIGAVIESIMNGYNDPRRSNYFTTNSRGEYRGVRNGITISSDYSSSDLLSKINCTNDDPVLWMAPAEAWFLRAEGSLRGFSDMGGTAQELYEQGIRVAFATTGIGGADAYIADDSSTPADYTDVVIGSRKSALSNAPIAWMDGAGFEENLEQIIIQKYIAMFPDGQEAWSEYRRTGYPQIFAVDITAAGIDKNKHIRRLNFPSSEYSTNAAAVAKAVATLRSESNSPAAGDNGATNVWWDKKNN